MSIDIKPGDGDFAVTSVGTLAPVFPLIPLGGSGAGAPAVMPGSHPSIRPTIVTVDPKTPAEGTDAPEVFKLTGAEGRPPSGDLGVILNYGLYDRIDLSDLGRAQVLAVTKVADVLAGRFPAADHVPTPGERLSLDLDGDGAEDAHLMLSGEPFPFAPLPTEPAPGGPAILPGPIDHDPIKAPAPRDWGTNMPSLPGGPGEGKPVDVPLGPGSISSSSDLHLMLAHAWLQLDDTPAPALLGSEGAHEAFVPPQLQPGAAFYFSLWGSWFSY
jgi:hypothetical protein